MRHLNAATLCQASACLEAKAIVTLNPSRRPHSFCWLLLCLCALCLLHWQHLLCTCYFLQIVNYFHWAYYQSFSTPLRRRRVRLVLFDCFVVLKDFWHLIKRNQIDILNNLNKQTDITIASPPRLSCLVRVLSRALGAYWNALWPEANWRGGWCCSLLSLSPGLSPSRVAKNR